MQKQFVFNLQETIEQLVDEFLVARDKYYMGGGTDVFRGDIKAQIKLLAKLTGEDVANIEREFKQQIAEGIV